MSEALACRAEQQRDRILDAARQCFTEHGFHAAGMARIAETAKMSPGLIYRYFDSKSSIIQAIIERSLARRLLDIPALGPRDSLVRLLIGGIERWREGDGNVLDPVLFAEICAESSRDPKIAEALCRATGQGLAELADWLQRAAQARGWSMPRALAQDRALALQSFIEGLVIRMARDREVDLQQRISTFDALVEMLLQAPAGH